MDTLDKMEKVETNKKNDKPKEDIKILKAVVFVDPYAEADEKLAQLREEEAKKQAAEEMEAQKLKSKPVKMQVYKNGVGKYIKAPARQDEDVAPSSSHQKNKSAGVKFKDFSGW